MHCKRFICLALAALLAHAFPLVSEETTVVSLNELWHVDVSGTAQPIAAVAGTDNAVIYQSRTSNSSFDLVALDPKAGTRKWKTPVTLAPGRMQVKDGRILLSAPKPEASPKKRISNACIVNLESGKSGWFREVNGFASSSALGSHPLNNSIEPFANHQPFFLFDNFSVYGPTVSIPVANAPSITSLLNPATGKDVMTEYGGPYSHFAVEADGVLFAGSMFGFDCIDTATGKKKWSRWLLNKDKADHFASYTWYSSPFAVDRENRRLYFCSSRLMTDPNATKCELQMECYGFDSDVPVWSKPLSIGRNGYFDFRTVGFAGLWNGKVILLVGDSNEMRVVCIDGKSGEMSSKDYFHLPWGGIHCDNGIIYFTGKYEPPAFAVDQVCTGVIAIDPIEQRLVWYYKTNPTSNASAFCFSVRNSWFVTNIEWPDVKPGRELQTIPLGLFEAKTGELAGKLEGDHDALSAGHVTHNERGDLWFVPGKKLTRLYAYAVPGGSFDESRIGRAPGAAAEKTK